MNRALLNLLLVLCLVQTCIAQQKGNSILSTQLRAIRESDQRYRYILNDWEHYTQKQKDSVAKALKLPVPRVIGTLWQRQHDLDEQNLAAVKKIITTHGYPGKSLVGDTLSTVAWYVIQHSPEIATHYPTIEAAGKKGELPLYLVAKMKDRLLTQENKPQLYGTQAVTMNVYDSAKRQYTRQLMIWPVADVGNLDNRRRSAGFEESIQETASRLQARFDPNLTMEQLEVSRKNVFHGDRGIEYTAEMKAKVQAAIALNLPSEEVEGSTFRYMQLADSFLRMGDTSNAARNFMQVDPYQLMFLSSTPATIYKLFDRFRLPDSLRRQYAQRFDSIYTATQSPSYDSFRKHYNTILAQKRKYDTAKGASRKRIDRQLLEADTAHAAFLVRYIGKQGWPSLQQGSLYAAYLATRHYDQWYNYLPAMHEAYLNKQIRHYTLTQIRANEKRSADYIKYKKAILSNAFEWDMSGLLAGVMPPPAMLAPIAAKARALCPDYDIYFVGRYTGDLKKWFDYPIYYEKRNTELDRQYYKFLTSLWDACETVPPGPIRYFPDYFIPSDNKGETYTLYIVPTKYRR